MSAISPVPIHPGLEALADGFCLVDAAHRVTYWNGAAERLFGVRRSDALGRPPWAVIPGGAEGGVREQLEEVIREGVPLRMTMVSAAELLPRHLAVTATPVEDGGVALHFRDATGEQRLADSYSQLLESIRDGFVAVDREWRIVYVNRAAELLLSIRKDRAVGTDLRELLPPGPESLLDALGGTMVDREARHLAAIHPEGRVFRGRSFDVWSHPLPDGGISILFEDVSARLEHEIELARLAAEAEAANRAKSRFFAAVSHELRTPLNAIVGYTHLLSTETYGDLPTGATRAAERASLCAEHLSRLIDDVLLLTTIELDRLPLRPTTVDVPGFLSSVLEVHRRQAEAKGLRFTLNAPASLPALESDPERLRQLLNALVTNAVKFTSRGEVRVSARPANGGEAGAIELLVADTGPGIAAEDRSRIFDAFEQLGEEARLDSVTRGTGLGLTLAGRLTRLLGGTIEVGGAPGEGSQFRLTLPLRPEPANGGGTGRRPGLS